VSSARKLGLAGQTREPSSWMGVPLELCWTGEVAGADYESAEDIGPEFVEGVCEALGPYSAL